MGQRTGGKTSHLLQDDALGHGGATEGIRLHRRHGVGLVVVLGRGVTNTQPRERGVFGNTEGRQGEGSETKPRRNDTSATLSQKTKTIKHEKVQHREDHLNHFHYNFRSRGGTRNWAIDSEKPKKLAVEADGQATKRRDWHHGAQIGKKKKNTTKNGCTDIHLPKK